LQESKAEKAIEALQEMSAATSKVIREGRIMTVKSEDLTIGDVVSARGGRRCSRRLPHIREHMLLGNVLYFMRGGLKQLCLDLNTASCSADAIFDGLCLDLCSGIKIVE